ncbi:MAG: alginate export family protein [Bdellovibrionales bacterium]
MKKLLLGLAAVSFAASANAEVTFSGNTYFSYLTKNNDNGVKDSNSDLYLTYSALNVNAKKGENLSFLLELNHVNKFGTGGGVSNVNASDGSTQQSNLVFVQEATASMAVSDTVTVTFGRSGLELNSGELVSKRPFDEENIAFDGVRLVHDADYGRLGLSHSVAFDNETLGGRVIFNGIQYTHKNLPEALSNASIHYVSAVAESDTLAGNAFVNIDTERAWLGANLKGDMANMDYRLDFENFSGTAVGGADRSGSMIDFEFGYSMPEVMDSRVALYFHTDSGETGSAKSSYDALYYDNHKYAGKMDVLGWGNLTDIAVMYSIKPYSGSTVSFEYHMFTATEEAATFSAGGSAISGLDATKSDLGSELDIIWAHNYSSGLYVNMELGMFMPGDAFGTSDETINRLYVETGFSF